MMIKLLDCTLRDGGYYTNWDFEKNLVKSYCDAMESLPIDYVEIGYRSIKLEGYYGEFFYCPVYLMKNLKDLMPTKKLVIILNEKDVRVEHINELLNPCLDLIKMVRLAINPDNFIRAKKLATEIKKMGFEVALNVMYMSDWKGNSFLDELDNLDEIADYLYMVDSYGGVFNYNIINTIKLLKKKTSINLGFHGHNNLEMALSNSICAIENGCKIIDSTITGMGRGAGNLKTELLLTYLNSVKNIDFDYDKLSECVSNFGKLNEIHKWGTNLPYMFSGIYSLPQKDVMEWVGMNRYPLISIVNALQNKKSLISDNLKLPKLKIARKTKDVLIIGGGNSVLKNLEGLQVFLSQQKNNISIVHTGLKYISEFNNYDLHQYYSLVGFEKNKLNESIKDLNFSKKIFVYPPHPRKMGTMVPDLIFSHAYELDKINFTDASKDSPLAIGIQIAMIQNVDKIYFIGFDGYDTNIDSKQFKLVQENQKIFNDLLKHGLKIYTLSPSKYLNINPTSIYSLIK